MEAQQEEASRKHHSRPALSEDDRQREAKRRTLELARARAVADLDRATAAPHKRLLEQTIAAIDEQIKGL